MHIVHALFTPSLGGLEQSFVNITQALAQSGHRVTAVVRDDAPYRGEVEGMAQGVWCERPKGFYDIRALWRMRRMLKAAKPDMVLAHAPRAVALMGYAAWGLGIPVCGMLHSYRFSRAKHADRVVVLTEDMRRAIVAEGFDADRVSVIGNMVAVPEGIAAKGLRTPLRLGAMGRLSAEKGFADLLEMAAMLRQRGVDFTLAIAGSGPEEAALKAQAQRLGISAEVIFEGWVRDKDVFFDGIDVLCLPSREESFGIVLLEAMSRGVAVVATAAPGPRSILSDGKDALVVPVGDANAMADAVMRLRQTPGLAEELAGNAFATVREYSAERITEKWNALAELTISEARAGRK